MEQIHRAMYGASMPSPSVPLSPNLHMFTNLDSLWNLSFGDFCGGFITQEAWLNKSLATGDWFNLTPLPSSEVERHGKTGHFLIRFRLQCLALKKLILKKYLLKDCKTSIQQAWSKQTSYTTLCDEELTHLGSLKSWGGVQCTSKPTEHGKGPIGQVWAPLTSAPTQPICQEWGSEKAATNLRAHWNES